mmetsp:Transcript_8390/g.12405  ORF Transcript_8390/g.12405 Transcript_8390/m.12405 type:complete len:236 (-) Transcript_8390:329-1036(-)
MDTGLIPADTKKSAKTDLIFVCPDLKSSPPINTLCFFANSMTPGTNVFCGDPLMYEHPSNIDATAYKVDGAISVSFFLMELCNASAVSFKSFLTSANRSVFAVHNTMTLSHSFFSLNCLISFLMMFICSSAVFSIGMTWFALSAWFDAIKSSLYIPGSISMFFIFPSNWCCNCIGNTPALFIALSMLMLFISHPPITKSFGSTIGTTFFNGKYISFCCSSSNPNNVVDACVIDPQ